jgi:uncharacterized protein (TIGR00106 family)
MLVEFSLYPLDKGVSVGQYVARSLDIVDHSGLSYKVHAMGTLLEGEWDECFGVIKQCFDAMRKECGRVEMSIKIDDRAGVKHALEDKVVSVEHRLGRVLQHA